MNKHLEKILRKMCEGVGAKFEEINFREDDWCLKYEWTNKQYKHFCKWLANYLYKNKKARQVITSIPFKTKKKCKYYAELFTFFYGWKIKY